MLRRHCFMCYTRVGCIRKLVRDYSSVSADEKETPVFSEGRHIPVMKNEILQIINVSDCKTVLDMTYGAGGHTRAILSANQNTTVYALDRDNLAVELAKQHSQEDPRVVPMRGTFSEAKHLLTGHGVKENSLDAVIMDLGCSSMQLDEVARGFSLSTSGPLDMRMDTTSELTAYQVVNFMSEDNLIRILKKYGEERHASRPVYDKLGRYAHPATRSFQALRIFVNDELRELDAAVDVAHDLLRTGGVCACVSFHSLEDRIVKRHFHDLDLEADTRDMNLSVSQQVRRARAQPASARDVTHLLENRKWEPVSRSGLHPEDWEVATNPRARSATLRAARKLQYRPA